MQAILKPDSSGSYKYVTAVQTNFIQSQYPALENVTSVVVTGACPYFNAIHTEKANGENTFSFTVPADHPDAQYVTDGNLVAFQDLDFNWQLCEIKRVDDLHGDGLTRTPYCEHCYYELIDDKITDLRPTDCSANFALTQALTGTRWQPGTVADLGLNSTNFYYESNLAAVQDVASVWGGELQFRVIVSGGVISARYVDLLVRRGSATGKQFAYGRQTKSIERLSDITSLATALYGRGKGVQVGDGYTTRLDFSTVVWSVANGDPADKPLGQEWVGDPGALIQWGRPGGRHRYGIFTDDNETDPAVLLQETWDALQLQKVPLVTYTLTVADLETLFGYSWEKVRMGDTTPVIDTAFSPSILVSARVIELDRDLLDPVNTKVVLGNFIPDTANDAVLQALINSVVSDNQGVWNGATNLQPGGIPTAWLNGIINTLNNEVTAGNGSVTLTDNNGIMIVDNAVTPTKALRLLGGLLAIANSKDGSGNWNWRTFGTGDGFTADQINAGTIKTNLVKISGNTNFYWDSDFLYIINPSNGDQQIRLSKEGIRFTQNGGSTWTVAIDYSGINMSSSSSSDGSTKYTASGVQVFDGSSALQAFLGQYASGKYGLQVGPCILDSAEIKVFDNLSNLKVWLGQYASGQYGLYVMGGQIYSTLFRSGAPGDTAYVTMIPPNIFRAVFNNLPCVEITGGGTTGNVSVFDSGTEYGRVTGGYSLNSVSYAAFFSVNSRPIALIGPNGNFIQLNTDGSIGATVASGKYFLVTGNLGCTGTKPAIHKTNKHGSRAFYARESPDVRFIIEGVASLVDGEATITLDEVFSDSVEPNTPDTPWYVLLTPYANMGLFVAEIGDGFIVVKSNSGTGSGDFAWSLSAIRGGMAGVRLEEFPDDQKE